MQLQRIVLGLAVAIGGSAALTPVSAQEYRGTWEQQMACTPDVWRLCSDMVPDVNRIVGCLRANTSQLSSNCRAVFDAGAEQQQANRVAPRGSQQMRRSQQQYQPQMAPPPQIAPPPPRPGYDDWDD